MHPEQIVYVSKMLPPKIRFKLFFVQSNVFRDVNLCDLNALIEDGFWASLWISVRPNNTGINLWLLIYRIKCTSYGRDEGVGVNLMSVLCVSPEEFTVFYLVTSDSKSYLIGLFDKLFSYVEW